jgi:rfaE bifunctional protein kinase chain/domain
MKDLCSAVDAFAGRRLLVWGDFVADRFLHGSTTRVSREAPALVLRYEGEEVRPGGAGNAALNAAALGAQVTACGFVGDDPAGAALLEALMQAGIDVEHITRRSDGATPVKTRVMAGGQHTARQQILRIDHETAWLQSTASSDIAGTIGELAADADAVMISDYGLETVCAAAAREWIATAPGLPIVLDSRHRLLEFAGVTAATPNEGEAEEALRREFANDLGAVEAAGAEITGELGCDHLLITRGSHGMAVFSRGQEPAHLQAHGSREIADVTGAGDTVIASFTLALAAGIDVLRAAQVANVAAGLAVLQYGTATVTTAELLGALRDA